MSIENQLLCGEVYSMLAVENDKMACFSISG